MKSEADLCAEWWSDMAVDICLLPPNHWAQDVFRKIADVLTMAEGELRETEGD